ncbi:MAG TPA: ABC transporter permease [Gammaproteobacteria bacterium]|nr:ABC transporter permease [Gammaproteobacteria bacterium]
MDLIVGWTGNRCITAVSYVMELTSFIRHSVGDWWRSRGLFNRATYRSLLRQIIFTGVDAMPVVALLALALGVVFTAQLIHLTRRFTDQADIIGTLSFLITFEIGPLLTSMILIGRSASAIAVDLGNMKQHGEIEALELLGININDYLIAPRLVAAAISQLVLAVYFSGIALYGGILFAGSYYSGSYLTYAGRALYALSPMLLMLFILKNIFYGFIIAGTACFHALNLRRSPGEVPQQTQRAIVNGLSIVFVCDGLLAGAGLLL